jgi:quercetin dioxygenase-like cupin family protein
VATIHRFRGEPGGWDWDGVPLEAYGPARPNVTVRRFISRRDASNNLELRYFELGLDAFSSWESHNYEHAVLILRGRGTVRLGEEDFPISAGDAIFIPANEVHRFQAAADEPLGFMCAVLSGPLRERVHGEQILTRFD